jgi:hypothetical protein
LRRNGHVRLHAACLTIYAQLTGNTPDGSSPDMLLILNDVAHAVSNIIAIHSEDSGLRTTIPMFELIQGTFVQGARAFLQKNGTKLTFLTVLRTDMRSAVTILRSARITFRAP